MAQVTLRDDEFPNDEEVFIVGSNKNKPEPEFTPPADPDPEPAPAPAAASAASAEPEPTEVSLDEDMDKYSQGVQKRMNQLTHRFHDERRAKEALELQNQEAIRIAQHLLAENERIQRAYNEGSQDYVKQIQYKIQYAEKLAEDKFRKAYEAGDTEGLIEAQKLRDEIAVEKSQLANFQVPQPQQQAPLQNVQQPVYNQQSVAPQHPQAPQRDIKAEEWAAANPWFGADEEMTSLAYGLHAKLVNSGVNTQSDEYYGAINKRMREVFPDYFGTNKPRASSPVAPAGRTATTAGKNEALNDTQKAIARKLGVQIGRAHV